MKTLKFLCLRADTDINTQRNLRFFRISCYFLSAMGFAMGLVQITDHKPLSLGFKLLTSDWAILLTSSLFGVVAALLFSYVFSCIIQTCDIFSLACTTPEDMAQVKNDLELMDKITRERELYEDAIDDEDTSDSFNRTLTQNYIKEQTHLLSQLSQRNFNRFVRRNVMQEIEELEKNMKKIR